MTANKKHSRKAKSSVRHLATSTIAMKAAVKRRVKSAATQVSKWSTAKKIGVATAAVAVPILAAVTATVVVKRRKQAAHAEALRKSSKARKA